MATLRTGITLGLPPTRREGLEAVGFLLGILGVLLVLSITIGMSRVGN